LSRDEKEPTKRITLDCTVQNKGRKVDHATTFVKKFNFIPVYEEARSISVE
jgi:hypothetical protein